jgi:hypothetical protein
MVDITILELNLEGADFTANAPGSGESASEMKGGLFSGSDDEESVAADESGGGPSPLPLVVGVAVLVLAVVAVRRLLGGEAEPVPA